MTESRKTYTSYIEEDWDTGDFIIPLPLKLLDEQGWGIGTVLDWKDNGDGTWTITKV